MRTLFIEESTESEAVKAAPWAAEIVLVDDGWLAFESYADYETWKNQK